MKVCRGLRQKTQLCLSVLQIMPPASTRVAFAARFYEQEWQVRSAL